MKTNTLKKVAASVLAAASLVAFGDPIDTQVTGSDHSSEPCTPVQHTGGSVPSPEEKLAADISQSQGKSFDAVLLGDSITEFWGMTNPEPKLKIDPNSDGAICMGIGGDRVQNLLWRVQNGALHSNYTTKYFTLMIGVNNGFQNHIDHQDPCDRAEDVAEATRLILNEIRTRHPEAKVLLMPILPYGFDSKYYDGLDVRNTNEDINDYVIQFVDYKRIFWVDLRSKYLNADGSCNAAMFGGPGGSYDAKGHYLHPHTDSYTPVFIPAVTNAMLAYLGTPVGTMHVVEPSVGYAMAAPNANGAGSATITVCGILRGTDANANPVASYSLSYELDDGPKTLALSNQALTRNSFVIPNVALGEHTCKVTVTTADNKELVTSIDFTMTDPWAGEPLSADGSEIRTDGTLVCAYAAGNAGNTYTVNTVPFACANGSIDNDNISWTFSQVSGSTAPSGTSGGFRDLLGHCWWMSAGGDGKAVTLKGLTPGNSYLVQIAGYRNYSGFEKAHVWIKESYRDANYMKILGDGWTYGGLLTGTFTATEATKTITVGGDNNWAVNAIQVRDLGASGVPIVVQPKVGSVTATTNETAATIFLSGIVLGTDDAGESANSYSVSYSLNNAASVAALTGQTGASAQFTISGLADGEYTCAVTITTDKNKTSAAKSVSFRIGEPPAPVIAPSIGSVSVSTNGTTATISLSGIEMGTDNGGVAATSYSVFYSLTNAPDVAALEGQSASTASFDISGLADGVYSCAVTIMTDANKMSSAKSVNFRIGEPPPMPVGWTSEPMDAAGAKFSTEGTLVYAYAAQGQTVNTISFTRALPIDSSHKIAFTPEATGFDGGLMNEGVSDSGYGLILGNGWTWTDSSTDTKAVTLTLKNLTPGERYLVQILSHTHWSGSMLVSANGCEAQHVYGSDEASGKYGALMTGTFTASAETQDVEILFSGSNGDRPVNAVQVRNLGEGGGVIVVAPSIGSVSADVSSSNATVSLSGIMLGTDDEGVAATSYAVSYTLNGGAAVAALSNQTGTSASFQISDLADGSYTCEVTITTDKNKTATKSVSFTIATSSQGGGGDEPGPVPEAGWTAGPMASDGSTIHTDGTLLYAYAVQGGTVGGVTFARATDFANAVMVSASPTSAGHVVADFMNEGVSGDFGHMLEGGWYWGGNGAAAGELSFVLTLKGLTAGKTYLLQLVSHRHSNSTLVSANGSTPVHIYGTHDGTNYTYGASIVGVFTASGATADFTVTYSAASSGMRPLNAIQVRELGEGGGGGEDPIDPVDPTTPVCTLTIPAKTGLQLQSVTTNGVAVAAVSGSYSIVSNTQVTVTFAAASGYEITDGNPVVFTLSGDKTFVDADYPTVQATSGGGGGDPVETGWTGAAATANGSFFSTDGTLLYAYAVQSVTVNGIAFAADADLNTDNTTVQPNLAQTDGNSGSEGVAGDFGTMLNNSWEWANSTSTLTITLKNLTIGKRYLAQFFAHNQWSDALISAGDLEAMAMRNDNKYGASLVYVFEAIANSESVVLKYSGAGGWRALNAVQVRELEGESPYVDPEGNMAEGCVLRISEILPKPTDARTLNGMEGMDVNGLESGWVEVENTSDKWADLADYRFIRVNRGKKTDPAGFGNFPSRLVPPHGRAIFYTSERYSNSKEKTVSAFAEGTFDGKPMIFENYGDILVWGDKVNPKKSPYVRLYYAPVSNGSNIVSVVDTVVIPSDLPEGWSIIVGDAAEGEGTRRWMCPTPTRGAENTATAGLVRIGPNVGPLYEKAGQAKTTYTSEFAAPVPPAVPGEDYSVTLPINGVMNPDGTFTPRAADQIQSIKFVYRKDLDDATLVTNEVNLATKTTDANWGDQYTATIPSSYFPAAGHLMQWKILITDGEGVEWTSPSFNNKDDGYEWYGTIVEPDPDTQMSATLPTWHMFASGNHLTQMDVDADKQNLSLVPHNARVAIYDSSTSNYYDYVRIDLRGNTSAGFTKKGHGLRFAKSHPMTMTDAVTGEAVEEIRKTSLISEFADPSYMRQMIAFWLWRKMGNLVPFDFPVRCNLNGEFYQLAFNSERFTDELIEDVYGLDKFGYGYKNVGTLRSGSGTTAGGIEKKTPDDEDESNITVLQNELRSKITAAQQVSSSPDGGSTGLDNAALTKFVVQKFDLPAWLNYLASARITQEMDDVWANVCAYYDNPAMLQGARGTGTWMPLGYDFNLSFGQYYRDNGVGGNGLFATNDWFKSHPFYGGSRVRCYSSSSMSTTINYGNDGFEAVWQSAKFRRLYLRRLRTLMDQELKEPGTPESEVPFMAKMREMAGLMRADAASDTARWPNNGTDSNIDVWSSRPASMDAGIDDIWDNYVVPRREHLYVTHSVTNTAKAVGYGSRLNAGIPEAQSPIETLAPNITADLSGLADGVVVISNGNNEVVDMSGWVLKTAVEWTLPAGTVCDAQDAIYVVADRRAYVAAHSDALTDQVIVGNATFSDTAVLQIFAADGTTQVLMTAPDSGDPDQANLRFHTIYGSTLTGGGDAGEFIVLTNVSDKVVNLEGLQVSCAKTKNGVTDAPKCAITLGDVNVPAGGSVRLDQADYFAAGWTKITNGGIVIKIVDRTGAVVQMGEAQFGLYPVTDEGGYALQATRFDNETPLTATTNDWTAVFVEAAAPDAPVIGGEGVASPIVVGSDKVSITISNAASGHTYGYKKSTTLAGLKDAEVVYFDDPAEADGVLTLEIPKVASEPSCFYQIVVE